MDNGSAISDYIVGSLLVPNDVCVCACARERVCGYQVRAWGTPGTSKGTKTLSHTLTHNRAHRAIFAMRPCSVIECGNSVSDVNYSGEICRIRCVAAGREARATE